MKSFVWSMMTTIHYYYWPRTRTVHGVDMLVHQAMVNGHGQDQRRIVNYYAMCTFLSDLFMDHVTLYVVHTST